MATPSSRRRSSKKCSVSMVPVSMVSMCRSDFEKPKSDLIGKRKQAYRAMADPTFETYGPKTDAEYDALIAERGGLPT